MSSDKKRLHHKFVFNLKSNVKHKLKTKKSHLARSGEYNSCSITLTLLLARNLTVIAAVWEEASSRCSIEPITFSSYRTSSRHFSVYHFAVTVFCPSSLISLTRPVFLHYTVSFYGSWGRVILKHTHSTRLACWDIEKRFMCFVTSWNFRNIAVAAIAQ